jgi:short-subunit dehydrogenase
LELDDRHVVVTGGSRGMGAAFGRAFAAAGARVTLVARNEEPLAKVAADLGVGYLTADVTAAGGLVTRLSAIAPIDVLVNNAGIARPGEIEDLSASQLREIFEINALAPAELARQVVPLMKARGTGRIVFNSSLSAQVALPGLTAYSATKAAESQFAEGLRRDLQGTGVGVTTVELGPVATAMYDEIADHEPTANAFNRMIRLGFLRRLHPDDVATAVVQACRADRDYVVRPRRAILQSVGAHVSQWLVNRILR